jgi:hypothetical protein
MPDTETAPLAAADSPTVPVTEGPAIPVAATAEPAPQPSLLGEIADKVETRVGKFDAVVDAWFNEQIHNSEISRITSAYNAVFAALDDLKSRLTKET